MAHYCVRIATEVEPRVTPPESLKRTKALLFAGSNGTFPLAATKALKVGVALALIVVVTLGPAAAMQLPSDLVWQTVNVTGRLAEPVSAETVIAADAPTLTEATEKAATPPLILAMPSLLIVADSATTSGTGVEEPDRSSVLTPTIGVALVEETQAKVSLTSAGSNAAVGVKAKTNVWKPLLALIVTGVLALPVNWLVEGLVVWNENVAGTDVIGLM